MDEIKRYLLREARYHEGAGEMAQAGNCHEAIRLLACGAPFWEVAGYCARVGMPELAEYLSNRARALEMAA